MRVNQVSPNSDYTLNVTFSNDEHRRVDMRPYLHFPVYRPLENLGFLRLAKVDYGTVVWPGEIDIAPETLYADSVPLPSSDTVSL